MKLLRFSLLSLVALLGLSRLQAQTADEIVAKHVDAVGGKDKIGQVTSVYTESNIQVMGNDAPSSTTVVIGKGFRSESEFNGQKLIQVYTTTGGWMVNPFAGGTDAQAMPDAQYKAGKEQMWLDGPFYNYQSRGIKLELMGKEDLDSVKGAYKIKVTDPDSSTAIYDFDPNTYYVAKITRSTQMNGQDIEIVIKLSNYQKTDFGLILPFGVETSFGEQFTMSGTVKKIEFNKPVDPKIFDMPSK
jgi:hypothetical protein